MNKIKMSKSQKKFIRKEKARIRKGVLNSKEQKELINNLYKPAEIESQKPEKKKEIKKIKKQTVKNK